MRATYKMNKSKLCTYYKMQNKNCCSLAHVVGCKNYVPQRVHVQFTWNVQE